MKAAAKALLKGMGVGRNDVADLRMLFERRALALRPRLAVSRRARVLCYHSVGQPQSRTNDVSPAEFRRQIEWSLEAGYRFVPARAIAGTGAQDGDLAITFDDGWRSVLTQAAPILKSYNIPWTVFVVSDWSSHSSDWARDNILSWRELEEVGEFGGEVGGHSASHADFGRLSEQRTREEVNRAQEAMMRELGFLPDTFAIPYGLAKNWTAYADRTVREAGYKFIFAQAEDARPAGTAGRTFITSWDDASLFKAALEGAFDRWEEWV